MPEAGWPADAAEPGRLLAPKKRLAEEPAGVAVGVAGAVGPGATGTPEVGAPAPEKTGGGVPAAGVPALGVEAPVAGIFAPEFGALGAPALD